MKAGIIGLGYGSKVLIQAFKRSAIKVHAISSRDFKKAKHLAFKNNIKKFYTNWKNLILDHEVDIVAIAVPPVFQLEMISFCLKYNKKIFAEKPMGINNKKITELCYKLRENKNSFLMDYIYSEHYAFKKFKSFIKARKFYSNDKVYVDFNLKKTNYKNSKMNWKADEHLGGGIINLYMPHIVDYLINFFGNILSVKCNTRNKNNLHAIFKFKTGLTGIININKNDKKMLHSVKYYSKKYNLYLVNTNNDFCDGFKIKFINKFKKVKKNRYIEYRNIFFNKLNDNRISLSSRLINKFKIKLKNSIHKSDIQRYEYNEYIMSKLRVSNHSNLIEIL